jgi:DNA-directed RNA polymerase beta' subunit
VDATRTLSDHITEVHEVLGIEATRELILREIYKVIKESSNDPPSRRHMMLLADTMTSLGSSLISIDRNGIKRSDIGPLARCSFEESDKQLYQAAIFGEYDDVNGVSANIMLGQVAACGTGMVNVFFDEDEYIAIQKSFTSDDDDIHTWEQHVEKWERDMQGMLHTQQQMDELANEPLPMFDESDLQVVDDDDEKGYDELSHSTHVAFDYTDDMLDDM